MATQTLGNAITGRLTSGSATYHQTSTATLTHTYTTSTANDKVTISGTLTLKVNASKSEHGSPTCRAYVSRATVTVNGSTKLNVLDEGVSVSASTSGSKSSSVTLGAYTTEISKTHAAQSIKVVMNATGLLASNYASGSATTDSYTDTVSVAARTSYTVSYAANGGSSTPSAQTKWYGEELTLRGAISRTGYTFYRWKATNGTLYFFSDSYIANAATTMTAQWTANTYTVKYNANGGTIGSTTTSSHTYDTAKNLTTAATLGLSRSNYLFKGWATTATGAVVYTNGQSVKNLTSTNGGTVNLYAVWEYQYKKPTFTKLTAWRTKEEPEQGVYERDDEGKNADISVTLSAGQKKDTANGSFANISTTVDFFYKAHTDPAYPLTPFSTQTTSLTGDTLEAHISDVLDTETQYDVRVVAYIGESAADSAARETFISTAYFLMDITDTGIAFGQASMRSAFENNMSTYLENEKCIYGVIHRKKADGGGWAYAPYGFVGDDDARFASVGAYGNGDSLTYMYIGANAYDSLENLRIYPNGGIQTGSSYITHGSSLYTRDTNSTAINTVSMNTSNQLVFGFGARGAGYDAYYEGENVYLFADTAIYANKPVSITGTLTVSGTYTGLYKITTVAVSVAALGANSYVANTSRTMTAQSGYNAVGIVGWASSNWRIRPTSHYVSNNTTYYAGFCNPTDTATSSATTVTLYFLWLKATSG